MKVNNFDNPVIDRKGDIQTLEEYSERNNVIMSDEFVPDKTYNPGDFVIYKNALWKCLVTCIGVIPTEGLHWTKTSLGEVSSSLFDEIANLGKYDGNEVAVGKWVDGKTIYRKIVIFEANSVSWRPFVRIDNLDFLVSCNGVLILGNSHHLPIPQYETENYNFCITSDIGSNSTQFNYKVSSQWFGNAHLIFEYTKK